MANHLKADQNGQHSVATIWNWDYQVGFQMVGTILDTILYFYHSKTDLKKSDFEIIPVFWIVSFQSVKQNYKLNKAMHVTSVKKGKSVRHSAHWISPKISYCKQKIQFLLQIS